MAKAFRNRLRHAARILGGSYPLPDDIEEFLMSTILERLSALEQGLAAVNEKLANASDPAQAIAALSGNVDSLKTEVSAISAEIGSEPAPATPAAPADPTPAPAADPAPAEGPAPATDPSAQPAG